MLPRKVRDPPAGRAAQALGRGCGWQWGPGPASEVH